jgi:hypothetical protein
MTALSGLCAATVGPSRPLNLTISFVNTKSRTVSRRRVSPLLCALSCAYIPFTGNSEFLSFVWAYKKSRISSGIACNGSSAYFLFRFSLQHIICHLSHSKRSGRKQLLFGGYTRFSRATSSRALREGASAVVGQLRPWVVSISIVWCYADRSPRVHSR